MTDNHLRQCPECQEEYDEHEASQVDVDGLTITICPNCGATAVPRKGVKPKNEEAIVK